MMKKRSTLFSAHVPKRSVFSLKSCFLITLGICLPLLLSAQIQKITINRSDVAVKEIFNDIKQQTGYSVVYNTGDLDSEKKVSLKVEEKTIQTVMDELLRDMDLTYTVKDKHIIISKKTAQPLKQLNITGRVVDTKGSPLIGVAVVVPSTGTGVTTDADGRYSLTVTQGGTISFSFLGYEAITRVVNNAGTLNVTLAESATEIEQVVVTGMVQMDKRLFTGATDKLVAENMMMDGVADISRSLEGRSSGVSVQNVSGTFGTAPKIRIRGATSIYGSSKPLWVVDGVIMEDVVELGADDLASGDAHTLIGSAIAGLNADDIESFQVLKDGSATSIYGARAMAGVIVITTKKGRPGLTKISYTGEYTIRMKPHYSDFNIMNSQDQMSLYEEMYEKGWFNFSDQFRAPNSGIYGKMYELMNSYDPSTGQPLLQNTEEARQSYLRRYEKLNTNWFDELFRTNIMHNHSVSVSTGAEKGSVYASMSVMSDPGWTLQSKVNRYTANLNGTLNLTKKVTLNMLANMSYRNQRAPGTLNQQIDNVHGEVSRDFDINPYSFAMNSSRTMDPDVFYKRNYAPFNIKHELKNNYMDIDVMDMRFQGELKWKIVKGLDISMLGALKYSRSSQEHRVTGESNQALAYRAMGDTYIRDHNTLLYKDPDNPYSRPISVLPQGGMYTRDDVKMLGYDFRVAANYAKVFGGKHVTNLYAGMEVNSVDRNSSYFDGWGLQYDMGETPFYIYEYFKSSIEKNKTYYGLNGTYSRHAAFFANAAYSYDGRYTLNGTVRYEGSNKLGRSRTARWLPTWNIAGGWNISKERFFEPLTKTVSHLQLKASYSLTGDRGPANVTNSLVILGNQSPYRPFTGLQESGISIRQLENSKLTYEKKHELNIGMEAGFLNNRINMVFDMYWRNNYDLIGPVFTQGVGGQIDKMANVAEMKSNGYEFSVSSLNIRSNKFRWSTDFVFSYSKSEVTKLESNRNVIGMVSGNGFTRKGYPARALFSIPFHGLNDEGFPIFGTPDGGTTTTGANFQGLDTDYLVYEGPTDPKVIGSLSNNFSLGNFKLNIFMTYSFGNVIRLNPSFSSRYTDLSAMPKEFRNRWMLPGDEKSTNIPVILDRRGSYANSSNYAKAYNSYNYSTARIAKGDFIRMKEISLSYDFPQRMLGKNVSSLSLKVQATNLFLLYADSKLNGQDPEFFATGGVATPIPKQFTMTLRIGF